MRLVWGWEKTGQAVPFKTWSEAVADAARRHVADTGSLIFTRRSLMDAELGAIIVETGSSGAAPQQTLSRELQELRDAGVIEFLDPGTYRWIGFASEAPRPGTSKGVFVIGSHSSYEDQPERFYRFPTRWMANASRVVGNWIIYQEPRRAGRRGYFAVAKVDRIIPDPTTPDMHLALIEPGSFLEFGRDVPFQLDGRAVERGLLDPDGHLNNGRAVQSIRTISDADFNRIVDLGLVDEDESPLPRADDDEASLSMVEEEADTWEGPVDRGTMLVSRKVRNRQFRKRVLEAYSGQCALTGLRLINGGGRPETQAAHVMSVKAGGPDVTNNGIALSGTVHWMFDRHLISLGDDGEIFLSSAINDIDGVQKLIHSDRRARWPEAHRPHPRYLQWHRERFYA